jgi:hypothetical protein
MTVNISPLRSQAGFQSPGFSVDATGQLVATGMNVSGDAVFENLSFLVNGQPFSFLESEDSVISLSSDIRNSSLTGVGLLAQLEVENDINLADVITIRDDVLTVNPLEGGSIDNVDIGRINPKDGFFLSLEVGMDDSSGLLLVKGNLIVTGSTQLDTVVSDDVSVNNQPTQANHATRKDYVDARISAFAVAFGA